MELQKLLADNNPASWEIAFRDFVQSSRIAIDDWLWQWLWCRIKWPNKDYSLFYHENILVEAELLGLTVLVKVGDNKQRRYVQVSLFKNNPYHPDFDELIQVSEKAWRFSSIGNPYLDEPNYRWWEKMLFCKLLNIGLEERKGLDFLIEQLRR